MKQLTRIAMVLLAAAAILVPIKAFAHFGMIIPSSPTVAETANSKIDLEIKFWHPFENSGLNLAKPKSFQVIAEGKATDALAQLSERKERGFSTWRLAYDVKRPGLHVFLMEPEPYFEPAEDKFIIHYTKAYVDAYGDDEGWQEPIGSLKTEIVPLARPGALYAGNSFTGQVLLDGKPVPGCEVEIEWYPGPDKKGDAPYESMVTQVALTDAGGYFSYSPPAAGWWGFAALNTADYKLQHDGEDKEVELGGVLWLYFHEFKPAVPYE
jgi:cobalt/nickel transport protein